MTDVPDSHRIGLGERRIRVHGPPLPPGMKILSYLDPGYTPFVRRLNRRALPEPGVRDLVTQIIAEVATQGDEALFTFTKRFDGATLTAKTLFVSEAEFAAAEAAVTPETKTAVARTLKNIHAFAKRSLRKDWSAKNAEGATVGERFTPFERVGVYVPGGKAPLVSTALMTAGFAQAAGVPEILSSDSLRAGWLGESRAALRAESRRRDRGD